MSPVPRSDDPNVRAAIAAAVRRVSANRAELTSALLNLLAAEIGPLQHDDHLSVVLAAGVDESVAAGLYLLEQDIDPRSLGAPPAAVQYARRLAQRGTPVSALLRAYRLGHAGFVETMLSELASDPASSTAASLQLLRVSTAYVDAVSELLVAAYEEERTTWEQHHWMVRSARIQALLAGGPLDLAATESALGYRLSTTHVAVLLWCTPTAPDPDDALRVMERAVAGAAAGGQFVFAPTDETAAQAWIGMSDRLDDPAPIVKELGAALGTGIRAALGRPEFGPAGFRLSHRQAVQARTVALTAGAAAGAVTTFAEVGVVALLCADLEGTRAWVADTLGPLAVADENAERLRETVRIFLNLGSSHIAAGERLNLHKNSVQHRIARAEALRGRPFREDRADVELALRACRLLGAAVLT